MLIPWPPCELDSQDLALQAEVNISDLTYHA